MSDRLKRWLDVLAGVLLVVGVLLVFLKPLTAMVNHWSASPMYSHAYVVPFISLGLLWARRQQLLEMSHKPSRVAAISVLACALVMAAVGELAAVQIVQQVAFVVTIAGVILWLFGFAVFKVTAPAVLYLLFMVPFWDVFTEPLHQPFQLNSAWLGTKLMTTAGVPAHLDGTMIALPDLLIEVARACSGVNYLIAVIALAIPLAFIRLRAWRRRILLLVGAVSVSVLANGLRVGLIGILAYLDIGSPLHGPFHVLHGLFVAGIGYVALFGGLYFLEKSDRAEPAKLAKPGASPSRWRRAEAFALACVFVTLAYVGVAPTPIPVALAAPLEELPTRLGTWSEEPLFEETPGATTAWNDADQQLRRRYGTSGGRTANIEIWYFSEQRQSHELVSFKVAELHRTAERRNIALPSGGTLTVNLRTWRDRNEVGMFWYELGGSPESREYTAKLRSLWSVVTSRRSHAAAIMLTSRAENGEQQAVVSALENLAVQAHLSLARHWPSAGSTSSRVVKLKSASPDANR